MASSKTSKQRRRQQLRVSVTVTKNFRLDPIQNFLLEQAADLAGLKSATVARIATTEKIKSIFQEYGKSYEEEYRKAKQLHSSSSHYQP